MPRPRARRPDGGRPDDDRPDGRWPDERWPDERWPDRHQAEGRWPDERWPDRDQPEGRWPEERPHDERWRDREPSPGGWPEAVDPWAGADPTEAVMRTRSGRRRAAGHRTGELGVPPRTPEPGGPPRSREPGGPRPGEAAGTQTLPAFAFGPAATAAFPGGPPAGYVEPGEGPGGPPPEQPPEQPPGVGRHGGGRRLGPIAIAAIVAAVLVAFGLGAVAVSPLFFHSGSDAAGPPPGFTAPSYAEPSQEEPTESPSPTPSRTASSGSTALESAVVALVNAQRAKARCAPVRVDERLHAAARAHSADMAAHSFLSHTGSDRSSPEDRMRRFGYPQPLSENIASRQRTAQEVMNAWMRAKSQRSNILDCAAKAVGVGVAYRADGTPYWTQDFGRV